MAPSNDASNCDFVAARRRARGEFSSFARREVGKIRQTETPKREGRRTLGFSFPTDACRASERAGWGREDARTFKTPLVSEDASAAASLSVAGDTGGCAYALGMELEGGGGANDMIDARLGPCDERSRPRRARGPASADARVAVEQRHPRDRADDSPVDRSRASRSTRRGTRPRWRRARRNAPALGQNSISPSLGLVRRCFSENAQRICRFASSRASAKKSARLSRETSSKNARADRCASTRACLESASQPKPRRSSRRSLALSSVFWYFFACMVEWRGRDEGTRFLVERASLSFFFPTVKRRRLRSL